MRKQVQIKRVDMISLIGAVAGFGLAWIDPAAAAPRPSGHFAVASIEPITDATTGVKIGIPAGLDMRTKVESWGRNWQTANRKLSVDTINYGNTRTLDEYFRGLKSKSSRVITSETKSHDRFVIKGYDIGRKSDETSIFHVEAQVANGELRGLSIVYSKSHQHEMAALAELIARSFDPFPSRVTPPVVVFNPPPPPPPPPISTPVRPPDIPAVKPPPAQNADIDQRFDKLNAQIGSLMEVIKALQHNNISQQNKVVEELQKQLAEANKQLATLQQQRDSDPSNAKAGLVVKDAKPLGRRFALVIGNNAYPHLGPDAQLRKAVGDAAGMRGALADLGFDVTPGGDNLDRKGMSDLFIRFLEKIGPGDTAFVFFSGHGVALNGGNFLLPTDAAPVGTSGPAQIRAMSISEADWIDEIKGRGAGTAIIVLDACRDNPLNRGGTKSAANTRGLTRSSYQGGGIFSIYSAGFGQKALDSLGPGDRAKYSVFTRVFIDLLYQPNTHLDDIVYQVREEVSKLAATVSHEQRPASYNEVGGGRIYLRLAKPSDVAIGGR